MLWRTLTKLQWEQLKLKVAKREADELAALRIHYLIPGYNGPPRAEWDFTLLTRDQDGKKISVFTSTPRPESRSKLGIIKAGLVVPHGCSKEQIYPTLRYDYPKKALFQVTPTSPKITFHAMCLQAGHLLRLGGPEKRPKMRVFVLFAAFFAAENPELWGEFLTAIPDSVEDKFNDIQLRVPQDLKCKLDQTARRGQTISSVVRGSAAWLALRLLNHKNDAEAARFLEPFSSGENENAAKAHPLENPGDAYAMFCDSESIDEYYQAEEKFASAMLQWQEERRKLLRWPRFRNDLGMGQPHP